MKQLLFSSESYETHPNSISLLLQMLVNFGKYPACSLKTQGFRAIQLSLSYCVLGNSDAIIIISPITCIIYSILQILTSRIETIIFEITLFHAWNIKYQLFINSIWYSRKPNHSEGFCISLEITCIPNILMIIMKTRILCERTVLISN